MIELQTIYWQTLVSYVFSRYLVFNCTAKALGMRSHYWPTNNSIGSSQVLGQRLRLQLRLLSAAAAKGRRGRRGHCRAAHTDRPVAPLAPAPRRTDGNRPAGRLLGGARALLRNSNHSRGAIWHECNFFFFASRSDFLHHFSFFFGPFIHYCAYRLIPLSIFLLQFHMLCISLHQNLF